MRHPVLTVFLSPFFQFPCIWSFRISDPAYGNHSIDDSITRVPYHNHSLQVLDQSDYRGPIGPALLPTSPAIIGCSSCSCSSFQIYKSQMATQIHHNLVLWLGTSYVCLCSDMDVPLRLFRYRIKDATPTGQDAHMTLV
ncbi:hypothetical protein BDR06DRAFT_639771 [Suillus hirtellus]|nr:hypothetical protein BDR06DRAFT_639771 [Suillus hirtellus]